MKIWKVYANCCVTAAPIKEIYEDEVEETIEEIISYWLDNDYIKFEEGIDTQLNNIITVLHEQLKTKFEESGYLEAGDYMLSRSEEIPKRPDSCSYESIDFYEQTKETN